MCNYRTVMISHTVVVLGVELNTYIKVKKILAPSQAIFRGASLAPTTSLNYVS